MSLAKYVVDDILKWINENIKQQLSIDAIAKYSGYSRWHLQRIFFYYTGERLATYIRKKKMELAANDLRTTQMKIIDISVKYGFESQQNFTRVFGKTFNVSPSAYRRLTSEVTTRCISYTDKYNQFF